jgi:outer membrane protein
MNDRISPRSGRLIALTGLLAAQVGLLGAQCIEINRDNASIESCRRQTQAANSAIDPDKAYKLEELIDLAERNHPRTRVAWEEARQAAAALGVARSEYLPQLSALAVLRNEKIINPFPKPLTTNGFTMVELPSAEAGLAVRYTVLDFGRRRAGLEQAKAEQLAAQAHLRRENQETAFAVIEAYYALVDAQQTLEARRQILSTSQTVRESAEAQLANGRATRPDLLDAEAGAARAEYELEAAIGQERTARVKLRESLGGEPSDQIRIAAATEDATPEQSGAAIAELVEAAQRQRPDLTALAAKLRASQEALRGAHAAERPTAEFAARGESQSLWPTVSKDHGSSLGDTTQFVWSAGVTIRWDLFEGGRRRAEIARRAAEERQSAEMLREQSHAVTRDVWTAFVDYQTAVRRRQSAETLRTAADASYASALEAYRYGVKNLIDLVHAESQLAEARLAVVQARSALFTSQANLGYTTGSLLSGSAPAQKP